MARLVWGESGKHFYETGVDRGVLYPVTGDGVAWNGLTSVDVTPSGGGAQTYFVDGVMYLILPQEDDFEATINAFTYPDEFAECDGSARVHSGLFATHQPRKSFGLSWRTKIGNELTPDAGYKIHLVYNALAAPSSRNYQTVSQTPDLADFSWKIVAKPPTMTGFRPTAHLEIDTRSANPSAIADIENVLYGSISTAPRLPTLEELVDIFETYAVLVVTDNGDGTFTVSGPDSAIVMLDASRFQITWPTAIPIDADTFQLSSL